MRRGWSHPIQLGLGAGIVLLSGACGIPPVAIPRDSASAMIPGPVRYFVDCRGQDLESITPEAAQAEAARVVGEFLEVHFDGAAPCPPSVLAAAALFPEEVKKEYAPLVIVQVVPEEIAAPLSWGIRVSVTFRIFNLRPWVDRHWSGFGEPAADGFPALNVEDHAGGWAERGLLHRRSDAHRLLGESLLEALEDIGTALRGNEWLLDFYRLPGRRDPIRDGPPISGRRSGRGPR